MRESFAVRGMHCNACVARIRTALEEVPGVSAAEVTLDPPRARVDAGGPVDREKVEAALRKAGDYSIDEWGLADDGASPSTSSTGTREGAEPRGFLATYRPLLLLALYLVAGAAILAVRAEVWWLAFLRFFMAGFFLAFSYFKLLDLGGFAASYSMYDLVAARFLAWGRAYPFVELGLGLLYLSGWNPVVTNAITLAVMSVGAAGVIRSMMAKRAVRCACLGTVFDLPVSNVTLIEDLLMAAMAGGMLIAWAV